MSSAVVAQQDEDAAELNEAELIERRALIPHDEAAEIAQPSEEAFDGLLTNDKFCLTRKTVLPLSWSRQPLRLRTVSLQNRGRVHAGGTDEAHPHLEYPTPADRAQRCAAMRSDAQTRWDEAYQRLLQWTTDRERAQTPLALQQEAADAHCAVRAGLDESTSPSPNH